jgi:fatty acid desaturase
MGLAHPIAAAGRSVNPKTLAGHSMSIAELVPQAEKSLQDPALKEKLQQLRQGDNYTNIYYLIRAYVFLALVIGATVWFFHFRAASGLSFWWNVPVVLAALALVGAGQHQLSGLGHEAAHHTLFKSRKGNEIVSDWLCMFPLYSTTHNYRLQHLAHHQFVNDPDHDPDVAQLQSSGHWLHFPLGKAKFLLTLLKQLWVPNLIRYMRIRAIYSVLPNDKNPYLKKNSKPSSIPIRVGLIYLAVLLGSLTVLVRLGGPALLAVVPALLWLGACTVFARIPDAFYHQSRLHPVISDKATTLMRFTYGTILFTGLAWLSLLADPWTPVYYILLWLVPIFTTFSFYMILRQLVQHGNGGRGWLTNTRVFLVHPFINFSVFPIGQDYHLPHHLYVTVPHFRLKKLHEALMEYPEYRAQATVVEGYFFPPQRPPVNPTVLDVIGPSYTPRNPAEVHIENSVLDLEEVEEKAEILRQGEEEIQRAKMRLP